MPSPRGRATRAHELSDRALRAICERVVGRAATATLMPIARAIAAEIDAGRSAAPRVRDEVEALARFIARARREIRSIGADEIADAYIPKASDELGAIATHLEDATGAILDACERIQGEVAALAPDEAGPREAIEQDVTRIFEACNFQDLTGQRIAKIVETLSEIEQRTHGLVGIVRGTNAPRGNRRTAAKRTVQGVDDLLNGPALPGQGVSQSDVDAMLLSDAQATR